ncbi:transcription repressor OFP8-like [Populus alba x Populus x berolinensis]|nr:transcription repressor OFP8-like [Populus alba x Populus x berolinensis]
MENRFRLRISRMFRGSCRTRNLSDVVEKAVFLPQNHKNFHLNDHLPPKARPFSSICIRKCPEATNQAINPSIISRKKLSHRYPPASPIFPMNPFYKELGFREKTKGCSSIRNRSKKKKKNITNKKDQMSLFSSSSQDSACFGGRYYWHPSSRRRKYTSRRRRAKVKSSQVGVLPLDGKVKDSFAVVKSSSDPYNDFRKSMVEMIVEKQIFAAKDLEQLLQCFLSLNSYHHHGIIVEVFMEIWEALFSNWTAC